MIRYHQKKTTLSEEHLNFLKENVGKMTVGKLSAMLGVTYNKVHNNLRVLGFVKSNKATVINMNGYFDVDSFQRRYYKY